MGLFSDLSSFENELPTEVPETLADLSADLRIYAGGDLEVWFCPISPTSKSSKLWILGITPGWTQMKIAYQEAAAALAEGGSARDAVAKPKPKVAFAGSMRVNLVSMLNQIEIPGFLGVDSAEKLFGTRQLRTGSVLRYPVFKKGKNYTGYAPRPTKHPVLKEMLDTVLAHDLTTDRQSLILPLGRIVEDVLEYCVEQGRVESERIIRGFPHPSGANGHRKRQFAANRKGLARQVKRWFN